MVALLTPAANAVVVDQALANGTADTVFSAPLALELDLASAGVPGTINVRVRPDAGFFNQGVQHDVVVDLPAGMVFNTNAATGGSDSTIIGTDATGGTTGAATTGNIFTGGDQGDSQVTFQIATNAADTTFFVMTLPVIVESCLAAGSGVNVTVETAGGFVNNDVDGDNTASAPTADGFGGCASAFSGSVTADFPGGAGADTFLALANPPAPSYTDIVGDDLVLGQIAYTANDVAVDSEGNPLDPATDVTRVVSTIELAGNPGGPGGADLEVMNGTITGGPVIWTVTQTGGQIAVSYTHLTLTKA